MNHNLSRVLSVVFFLFSSGCALTRDHAQTNQLIFEPTIGFLRHLAILDHVIDGDTIDIGIICTQTAGQHSWTSPIDYSGIGEASLYKITRVRLIGIDCPELPSKQGQIAKQATSNWLIDQANKNAPGFAELSPDKKYADLSHCIILISGYPRYDKYHRLLALVYSYVGNIDYSYANQEHPQSLNCFLLLNNFAQKLPIPNTASLFCLTS